MLGRIEYRGLTPCGGEISQCDNGRLALGVNRLPIESNERRRQPRMSQDGHVLCAYNGEIYNWRQVNASLTKAQTPRDETQAVVDAVAERGIEALVAMDGMFAVAWFDARDGILRLARDRFGIKPLYFSCQNSKIMCASEIKSLVIDDRVESVEWCEPGCVYEFSRGGVYYLGQKKQYVNGWAGVTDACGGTPGDLRRELRKAVGRAVETRNDVAVLLSGGVDSAAVLAMALEVRPDVAAVTVGCAGSPDIVAAKELCDELGVQRHVSVAPAEEVLFDSLPEVIRVTESFEPNVVRQAAATRLIARAVRELGVRVVISGEGADEMFGGYPEFKLGSPEQADALRELFMRDLHRTQLQRVDRIFMEQTVEARVPFLSNGVACVAKRSRLSDWTHLEGKGILREALKGVVGERWRTRKKIVLSEGMGFGGNDVAGGMFSSMTSYFEKAEVSKSDVEQWSLRSAEERYYFSLFRKYGYHACKQARERVIANTIASR